MTHPPIHLRRIYALPDPELGLRVLVDRLWPRGVSREAAALDLWAKSAAPSNELRRWIHEDPSPERWRQFGLRYRAELEENPEGWSPLADAARKGPVVLLFAARDPKRSHAEILRAFLEEQR